MMYEGIRGALASDNALAALGEETRFRVRETPDWKEHAADLGVGLGLLLRKLNEPSPSTSSANGFHLCVYF